jgi:acetyl-CoA carboxylase biotin carboxylase subunit
VTKLRVPGGLGVRFDTLLYPGYAIPPFYDSLLGKLIVWAEDRPGALARLKRALGELTIEGVKTTAPLFQALLEVEDVRRAAVHTRWLESWLAAPQGEAGRREARGG